MAFYTAPNIPTIDNVERGLHQLTPEPTAESLQRTVHTYRTVEANPIIERTGAVLVPPVMYTYGWSWPQQWLDGQITQPILNPGSSPGVPYNTSSYSKLIDNAAKPTPQLSATGVYGPLRAPGINEGL